MAFCTKCGKPLNDGDRFCYHCGEPVSGMKQETEIDTAVHGQSMEKGNNAKEKQIQRLLIAGISVLGVIVILLVVVLLSSGNSNSEKDLADNTEPVITDTEESGVKDMVADIISGIKSQSGFVTDSYREPLAVCDDFNGDGIKELLAVYEIQRSDIQFDVVYELWSLPATGAVRLKSEVLFIEVGGNSGLVGIVQSDDTVYLAIAQYEPEGDVFNNYYIYWPWKTGESSLGEDNVYMESHGTYDEEEQGRYILGDTKVDRSTFDAKQNEFSNWLYELDIFADPGNGDAMTFDALLSNMK